MSTASCCTACATHDDTALTIASTLDTSDFKARVHEIRALSSRSLLRSERTSMALKLNYDQNAIQQVEELIAREAECCAFLTFSVTQDAAEVHLRIWAAIEDLEAADQVFAHFAPEPARQAS